MVRRNGYIVSVKERPSFNVDFCKTVDVGKLRKREFNDLILTEFNDLILTEFMKPVFF